MGAEGLGEECARAQSALVRGREGSQCLGPAEGGRGRSVSQQVGDQASLPCAGGSCVFPLDVTAPGQVKPCGRASRQESTSSEGKCLCA